MTSSTNKWVGEDGTLRDRLSYMSGRPGFFHNSSDALFVFLSFISPISLLINVFIFLFFSLSSFLFIVSL
jgi:hypothetical protein